MIKFNFGIYLFLIVLNSFNSNPCGNISVKEINAVINNYCNDFEVISSQSINNKRYNSCEFINHKEDVLFKFSLKENGAFDKFPDLFSQSLNKYTSQGEKINKIGSKDLVRVYQPIQGVGLKSCIYSEKDFVRLIWIEKGDKLFILECMIPDIDCESQQQMCINLAKTVNTH